MRRSTGLGKPLELVPVKREALSSSESSDGDFPAAPPAKLVGAGEVPSDGDGLPEAPVDPVTEHPPSRPNTPDHTEAPPTVHE